MIVVFCATLFLWLILALHSIIAEKRVLGLNIFVLVGIYVPMGFYYLGWSLYIDADVSDNFYLIFSYLNMFLILYNMLVKDGYTFDASMFPSTASKSFVLLSNVVYVLLFGIESYMGSGSFAPALAGIDIHTYSAPIIAFVTRSLYAFVIMNFLAYITTKQRRYLLMIAILIALPVVTRNMRITSTIALVQFASFAAVYFAATWNSSSRLDVLRNVRKAVQKKKLAVVVVVIIAVAFVGGAASMTNDRMSHYGRYDLNYSTEIAYTGPDFMSDVISVYYGYFPLSFNNLNLSLKYGEAEHNYIGLYSYKSLYFGILQWDNVFGLNPAEPDAPNHRVAASPSANVATAFWDYWYDYGYFCFIPIAAMVSICGWITSRLQKKPTLLLLTQYHYFIPLVFFQSFQNVFFGAETLVQVAVVAVLLRFGFPQAVKPSRRVLDGERRASMDREASRQEGTAK